MLWLTNKKIMVTGGTGFLGKYVIAKLQERGCQNIFIPASEQYNLVDNEAVKRAYMDAKPDVVIHLAAKVGGIGATSQKPGEFFYENIMMGIQAMEQGRLFGVEKFVAIGTVCAYPKNIPLPFKEENLWDGYPEETNASYGLAKKMTLVQAQAYRKQYDFNAIYLLPVNLYGPGDDFDPDTSHAIPALIKKCVDAKMERSRQIVLWGTGNPTREYLYVEDAAEGIVLATEMYDKPDPVNLGSGFEISLNNLAEKIADLTGFHGEIIWDTSMPDGQPRRAFDTSRAEREFDFRAKMPFSEGLAKTVSWYVSKRAKGLVK